ncbi:MAG: hypothetical protein ACRDZV_13250, partial [Acidimicrobiia bacterium]
MTAVEVDPGRRAGPVADAPAPARLSSSRREPAGGAVPSMVMGAAAELSVTDAMARGGHEQVVFVADAAV